MSFYQLLTLQFVAHLLADFFFQTDKWVESRNNSGIKSRYFSAHLLIVFITSWLLSFQWKFIIASAMITLLHAATDYLKIKFSSVKKLKRYIFFIDQFIHVGIILYITSIFGTYFEIKPWFTLPFSGTGTIIAAAFLFCLKPSNIIIREILHLYKISAPINENEPGELPNAGKLIGNLERLLTLIFILTGRYEAVGFLIAAKSILRFGEKDAVKSEYVLTGTLLSFGIAIIIGIFVLQFL
ncbi:DUF3307 domain-containing protein [Alkalitalea saponilacus]|uniref:DUF3307 domain-containing protein n=1 Tax=Alkalitalea saponilacus TaxID=889453 RepID=A0A1T5HS39_9BACT|nr:DUF3307 domain-containing protein [Alkalitalea saponilacus]ASB49987.1 hypothetical protein CDL62_12995 [Alkalitalea saponilacus]SKC23506.1 Protein of unknown function [Alkalitalea saponilacus]